MKQKINKLILFGFLLLILAPVVTINHESGKISTIENRTLAAFPNFFDDMFHLNNSVKLEFENWLNDNIGFREQFVQTASWIKFNVLGIKSNDKVHAGKDGWFFYTLDHNLQIAQGNYPMDKKMLESIRVNQEAVKQRLYEQGIEYILVLPVSKASIYPEMIQTGNYSIRKTLVDLVADYLEETTDIKIVRLKESLLEKKKEEQVFFKTDTHWNEIGAYTAYKTIIENMNKWGILKNLPVSVTFENAQRKGEFSAMLGNTNLLQEESFKQIVIPSQNARQITDAEADEKYQRVYEIMKQEALGYQQTLYINDKVMTPKVLMYGDSMFASWHLPELMAETFSEFSYMWARNINQEVVDLLKPDVVVYELTERYLNTLPNFNGDFICSDMKSFQSEIVNCNIPQKIVFGQPFSMNITVKNVSDKAWLKCENFRLGALAITGENCIDTGLRAEIESDEVVDIGENYTFYFDDLVLDNMKCEKIRFTMLREGYQYFGEYVEIPINRVNIK